MSHWKKKASLPSLRGKGSLIFRNLNQSPKIGYLGPEIIVWKNGELTRIMEPFTGIGVYARRFWAATMFEILVEAKRFNAVTQDIALQAIRFNGSVQVA